MKKNLLLLAFALLAGRSFAQNLDSLWVAREVDSLIQVSRALTGQKDIDQALAVNAAAEKLALEKLGRETAAYGSTCFNHGRVLYYKKDLAGAEKWYLDAKAIREKVLGKEHPDYAWCLNNLGNLYKDLGNYATSESCYLEALAIREKVLGKENPDYITSLSSLAKLYMSMGDYGKAEPLLIEARDIRERTVGKKNADYAKSLNELGSLYFTMGNYTKAESSFIECKDVREQVLGKEHPDYARILFNLAYLYQMTGNLDKSETYLFESKDIMGKLLGKGDPDYAQILNNLGYLNYQLGKYEMAEANYIEAKNIREKVLGKAHFNYGESLSNLGLLYIDMGNYEKAESCLLESKDIAEKSAGDNREFNPNVLINLGILYYKMANNEEAERYYIKSKLILEQTQDKENSVYFKNLNNLAMLYQRMKKYEQAEALWIEVKNFREKLLGINNPEYARTIGNLGQLYLEMGKYERAESLFLESKSIREKSIGRMNAGYADNLSNLGILYQKMGNNEKAEPFFLESQLIRDSIQGNTHPDYVKNLEFLGLLYWEMGNYEKSEPLFEYCAAQEQDLLIKALHYLSERELSLFLNEIGSYQNQILSFSQATTGIKLNVTQLSYDNILFYKGFLLNAGNQVRQLVLRDTAAAEKFNLLKSYERRLATEYVKPILERKNVLELEAKANVLEKDLARTVAGYGDAKRQVKWQAVQSALKPGEAAVEFIHYEYFAPKATDSIMYAALVLRPDDTSPQFIPLFEKNELKELMRGASGGSNFLKINALYSQKSLYDLVWKPLEPLLTGIKTIYYAPSGMLHRLNLAAISTPEGKVYGERRQLVVMGSTRSLAVGTKARQLVVANNNNQTNTNTAFLAGGIRYDSDSTAIAYANRGATSRSIEPSSLTFQPDSLSITRGGVLDYLPATAAEVREIGQTLSTAGFQTKLDTGFYATEESFRQLGVGSASPRIIHLATHGYFFPDPVASGIRQSALGSEPVFKMSDHPMIRSGLILAGAKQAWLTGKHPEGKEDGVLTAYEISQMNLSGTELVVLSACETGLGDIVGNEGVYGLQRAFKIAGAKYLIMSLWKVDDQSTRAFMTSFYRHWLTEKQTVPQAFRSTQREMRAKYEGAYDWAGFVLIE